MKTGLNTALDPTRRSNEASEFETELRRRIVGHEPAADKVAEIYQMFLAGLNPPERPVGNLLFLGPTDSGKTRVVEAMAESLFGDAHAYIKIDCGEFQHLHDVLLSSNRLARIDDRPRAKGGLHEFAYPSRYVTQPHNLCRRLLRQSGARNYGGALSVFEPQVRVPRAVPPSRVYVVR